MRKRLRKKLERRRIARKFNALAAYVVRESRGACWLQAPKRERRTALLCLLYMIDFKYYAEHGESVTGMDWFKGSRCPKPRFPKFEG